MLVKEASLESELSSKPVVEHRSLLLFIALLAAVGAAVIYLFALPALWRMSWPYGLLFAVLGVSQVGMALMILVHPARQRVLLATIPALAVLVLWALARLAHVLPSPDPWIPVNSVLGFTDYICAGLEVLSIVGLLGVGTFGSRPRPLLIWRVLATIAAIPVIVLMLLVIGLGVSGSSDGFSGAGFPGDTVSPQDLPAGKMSTVEYCRPAGVPLAMDVYTPVAQSKGHSAPVVLYVHGGGLWGDRKLDGFGAQQANQKGALFPSLQKELNERGFVVASIDYRLPPGTPWPAPIEDAKCAIRFLRAHAEGLGIDPNRIGVWGSSSGGNFSSMLGLTGPEAGFDRGQYIDQSSAVEAVVDMFGLADLNDFEDADPIAQFLVRHAFSTSPEVLRLASPLTYVTSAAPPFLILHGTNDPLVRPRQSDRLMQSLQKAGVAVMLIKVEGAEHDLTTPGQSPSPEELTATVVDFFVKNLK
jgi:acetyl esterase/lipase